MLSDSEAQQLSDLGGEFLSTYVKWCSTCTDAPTSFHLMAGLSLISAVAGHDLTFDWTGLKKPTLLYNLFIGASGQARKTTCVSLARQMLNLVEPTIVGAEPGSDEALVDSLTDSEKPNQILFYEEFGAFLNKTVGSSYLKPIRTRIVQIYDGNPVGRKKAKQFIVAQRPRLNLLSASTLAYLEENTSTEDWTGGFMSRFSVMAGVRERTINLPKPDTSLLDASVKLLAARTSGVPIGRFAGFEPKAFERFDAFQQRLSSASQVGHVNAVLSGLTDRIIDHVLKFSVLSTHDLGLTQRYRGETWVIPERSMRFAVAMGEALLSTASHVNERIAENFDRKLRRQVLDVFPEGQERSAGQLIRDSHLSLKALRPVLESLVEEGVLRRTVVTEQGVSIYERIGNE